MDGFITVAWISLFALIGTALAFDLTLIERLRKEKRVALARNLSLGMWSLLALAYGVGIGIGTELHSSLQFFRAMLIEGALSLDNIVLLLVTLSLLEPKREAQHRILTLGILATLFIRGGFVMAGFSFMSSFSWISIGLGAILVLVGLRGIWSHTRATPSQPARCPLFFRALLPSSKPSTFGSIFLLIIGLESMNSVMSLDSLSAILITSDRPLVVFSASMFGTILLRTTARFTHWLEHGQERIMKATPQG